MNKIKSQKEIIKIAENLKKKNKKIVVLNGSFDILHLGHIKSLEEAKAQGDVLIVLLNSDQSVRTYKGPHRPIIPQEARAQTLAALECVDYVTIFDELTPEKLLGKIKPDLYGQGRDWGENCIERKTVEKNKGKIYLLNWSKGLSTSGLIKKILEVYSLPVVKAVFLDRDGTINLNEPEFVHKIGDFKFIPEALIALQKLSQMDYKIIITTNQSGIGRGYFKKEDLEKLHQWMLKELKKKDIRIDKIYYCPHHPDDNCSCRKPEIGMLLQAVEDFGINLSKSWVVGDDDKDVIMGRRANVKTIKIGERIPKEFKLEPNFYAKNLLEAVKIIQENEG